MPEMTATANRLRSRTMAMLVAASRVSRTVGIRVSISVPPEASSAPASIVEDRLDAGVQRGAGDGVGGDRAHQAEEEDEEDELDGDQRQAGEHHQADEDQAGAERIGDRRAVHAGEHVGQAQQADARRRS